MAQAPGWESAWVQRSSRLPSGRRSLALSSFTAQLPSHVVHRKGGRIKRLRDAASAATGPRALFAVRWRQCRVKVTTATSHLRASWKRRAWRQLFQPCAASRHAARFTEVEPQAAKRRREGSSNLASRLDLQAARASTVRSQSQPCTFFFFVPGTVFEATGFLFSVSPRGDAQNTAPEKSKTYGARQRKQDRNEGRPEAKKRRRLPAATC